MTFCDGKKMKNGGGCCGGGGDDSTSCCKEGGGASSYWKRDHQQQPLPTTTSQLRNRRRRSRTSPNEKTSRATSAAFGQSTARRRRSTNEINVEDHETKNRVEDDPSSSSSSSSDSSFFDYEGINLHSINFPLGGFGTGNFIMAGNGTMQQFGTLINQIQPKADWRTANQGVYSPMPNTWFGVSFKTTTTGTTTRSTILRTKDHSSASPSDTTTDDLPTIPSFTLRGQYPIADINYQLFDDDDQVDDDSVGLKLETFTPFNPGDVKHSSLPCGIFAFEIENKSSTECIDTARIVVSQENFIGWDGIAKRDSFVQGTINTPLVEGGLLFTSTSLDSKDPAYGSLCWMAVPQQQQQQAQQRQDQSSTTTNGSSSSSATTVTTVIPNANNEQDLWEQFINHKDIPPNLTSNDAKPSATPTATPAGPINNGNNESSSPSSSCCCGGVVQTIHNIQPNSKATISFVVTWYFPNRTRNQAVGDNKHQWDKILPKHIGNFYSTKWFPEETTTTTRPIHNEKKTYTTTNTTSTIKTGAQLVADYVVDNYDFLCNTTRLFRDTFYGKETTSSIPPQLLQLAGGQLATMRSQTMWMSADGIVMGTEGNGCCPLNCTHVYGYTTLLERLFPELAQNMLTSNFVRNYRYTTDTDTGGNETAVAAEQQQQQGHGDGDGGVTGWYCGGVTMRFGVGGWAIDGALACIIKAYLVTRQADPNLTFLRTIWPNIKDQLERIERWFDNEGDGILRKPQFNTYDTSMNGANTFIGSYYVTALRAVAKMANCLGEKELAKKCKDRAVLAAKNYETICWNQQYGYYIADVTEKDCENSYGPGCFVDQLCAVGLSSACGLGHVLDPQHEALARKSIVANNIRTKPPFQDLQQHFFDGDSGVTVCSYPHGKLGKGMMYDTLVSSGFTSPVIAGLLLDQNTPDALYLADLICKRQDGRNASPWNQPECNMHYSRMMAHWNLFDQATGFRYSCIADIDQEECDDTTDIANGDNNVDSEKGEGCRGGGGALSFDPRFSFEDFRCFVALHEGWGRFEQMGVTSLQQQQSTSHELPLHSGNCKLRNGSCALTCLHGIFRLKSLAVSTNAKYVTATLDFEDYSITNTIQVKSFCNGKAVFENVVVVPEGSTLRLKFSSISAEKNDNLSVERCCTSSRSSAQCYRTSSSSSSSPKKPWMNHPSLFPACALWLVAITIWYYFAGFDSRPK